MEPVGSDLAVLQPPAIVRKDGTGSGYVPKIDKLSSAMLPQANIIVKKRLRTQRSLQSSTRETLCRCAGVDRVMC